MTAAERELLERRARALARPPAAPAIRTIELVTFALGGETYGIESRYVVEVLRPTEVSRLPGAEPPLSGITTWRGSLLNVVDLRPILGISTGEMDSLCRLVVLGEDRPAFGMLADKVYDLLAVLPSAVLVPPEGVGRNREYLQGVTSDAVIVLAADKLLALIN